MINRKSNNLNNIIKPFFDLKLLFLVVSIILFGLLVLTTASIELSSKNFQEPFHYLLRQIAHLLFSVLVCSIFLYLSSENLKKFSKLFYLMSFLLLCLVLIPGLGHAANGSMRWLSYGGLNIQPSEFFKLFYIIWLCAYLDNNKKNIGNFSIFIFPFIVLTFAVVVLIRQPDFGSIVVLFMMTLLILFFTNARYIHIFSIGSVGSVGAALLIFNNAERLARFDIFNPCQRYLQDSYNLCHSLLAISSGGISGSGLGAGTSKLFYLFGSHTDFIFSVLAEELGIFGVLLIVILFYLFIRKCFFIGDRAIRVGLTFQGYLSYAIGIYITLQAYLNISVNLGLIPTKGLALPFFSYGGSNYLASMLAITIIFRIYRDVYKKSLNSSIR